MHLVQVLIPKGKRDSVLDDEKTDDVIQNEAESGDF
jgi:hypothetical protein